MLPPNNPNGQLNHLNLQNKAKNKNLATESDEPRPKISQDHYRHIHEQRDFTLENLSLAGFTDVIDYSELKIMPEFEFEIDAEITQINKEINEESEQNLLQPKIEYRFRIPEAVRLGKRIKNRYQYIGGMPLSMCQVENIPVIQNLSDQQMLLEYTFLADQFMWLQEQKHPRFVTEENNDGSLSPKSVK